MKTNVEHACSYLKTIDCVKERIDSCLSGSEFVNPFFAFSSLLFFLV